MTAFPQLAVFVSIASAASACSGCDDNASQPDAQTAPDAQVGWARGPDLPEPVSNNAVASVETEGGCMIFSLLGIDASRDASGTHNRGFRIREGDDSWISLPSIPGPPRLATNAVGLRGEPYLLGGYEVQAGGTEVSANTLQRFDLAFGRWQDMAPMPIAVDDVGAATWRDRYIVVVSGWSDTSNVDAVQIYDAETDSWLAATSFPGTPVFGQSMAISGDELVLIDGVRSGGLGFSLVNQAWRGTLNPKEPGEITWVDLGEHPGEARYRAAGGTTEAGAMWFHGGTAQPYNFDGLRYDNNQPATPLASTLSYQAGVFSVSDVPEKPNATMDHRALVPCGERMLSIGGMVTGPEVTAEIWSIVP